MALLLPNRTNQLRLAGGFAAILASSVSFGQQNEYSVKAAFLVNFLKFIEWPDTSGPYVIEVVGKNPFGGALDSLANGKTVNGRKVVVRYGHQSGTTPSIIFVPVTETEHFSDYLQFAKKPVVVIGESPGFARKFGAFNFVFDRDRISFEINPKTAKNSGVKVSSRLLQLAKIVE